MLRLLAPRRLYRSKEIQLRRYCIKYVPHQFTLNDATNIFNEACNSFTTTELYKTDNIKGSIISAYVPFYGCYSECNVKYDAKYIIYVSTTVMTNKGSGTSEVEIKFNMNGSLNNLIYDNNDRIYAGCEFPEQFINLMFYGLNVSNLLRDIDISIYKSSIEKYALHTDNASKMFCAGLAKYINESIKNDINQRVKNNGIDIKNDIDQRVENDDIDIKGVTTDISKFTVCPYLLPIYIHYDIYGNAMFIQGLDLSNVKVYGHKKLSISKTSLLVGGVTVAALAFTPISATGLALIMARLLIFTSVTSAAGLLAGYKQSLMNKLEENKIISNKHYLDEQIHRNIKFNEQLISNNYISFKMPPRLLICSNIDSTNNQNTDIISNKTDPKTKPEATKNKRMYVRKKQFNKSISMRLLNFNRGSILTEDSINHQFNKCILELQFDNTVTAEMYKLKSNELEKAKHYLLNGIHL
jgi:hypothetical protein